MSLRFNHIFLILLSLSFLSAFALPARMADLGRIHIEGLFAPISWPFYRVSSWARGRMDTPAPVDNRVQLDILRENEYLRQNNLYLRAQIDRLQALAGERQSLGDLQSLCDRVTVCGADSGSREGLMISGNLAAITAGDPAIYAGGLAGKVDQIGGGTAHVRLVSDPGFLISAKFVRFPKADAPDPQPRAFDQLMPIVQGIGGGRMAIVNLPFDDVTKSGVAAGDWIVVADDTYPQAMRNLRIGQIASIVRWTRSPLHAEIQLQSGTRLMGLQNLYILNRGN